MAMRRDMFIRLSHLGALALGLAASGLAAAATAPTESYAKPAAQWWADITALAGDNNEGRLTGSPGYLRAANYRTPRSSRSSMSGGQTGITRLRTI